MATLRGVSEEKIEFGVRDFPYLLVNGGVHSTLLKYLSLSIFLDIFSRRNLSNCMMDRWDIRREIAFGYI